MENKKIDAMDLKEDFSYSKITLMKQNSYMLNINNCYNLANFVQNLSTECIPDNECFNAQEFRKTYTSCFYTAKFSENEQKKLKTCEIGFIDGDSMIYDPDNPYKYMVNQATCTSKLNKETLSSNGRGGV